MHMEQMISITIAVPRMVANVYVRVLQTQMEHVQQQITQAIACIDTVSGISKISSPTTTMKNYLLLLKAVQIHFLFSYI